MITKNAALESCIELLQEFLNTADNDQADTVDLCIQQARGAIAIPDLPSPPVFDGDVTHDFASLPPETKTNLVRIQRGLPTP